MLLKPIFCSMKLQKNEFENYGISFILMVLVAVSKSIFPTFSFSPSSFFSSINFIRFSTPNHLKPGFFFDSVIFFTNLKDLNTLTISYNLLTLVLWTSLSVSLMIYLEASSNERFVFLRMSFKKLWARNSSDFSFFSFRI